MEEFRQHIEKLSPLTDEKFNYIFSFFKSKIIKKHRFLIQEGDAVHFEYWVLKGCLKASVISEDGKDRIIRFAMEDWWISDYDAYFKKRTATLNVECLEDCELLVLSFDYREKLCRELPEMEYFFRKKIEGAYAAFQKRLVSLLCNDAKERYEIFLQQYPMLIQRVPKSIIASYLGISRETLSRISKP
ncbi:MULTISPECIES: Crp/Fnr family transcriptional regulator [unclassified Chryseobacterium]|uniref:Crp/Fnr family transcriptional regulator n=1 Tax=unclassified Chryseobacterium TaxID=2593645 RepID=UPI002269BA6F|nr:MULTISPECIES: Crp/Fnr family transcriptional regulator [unclassified Chryseobacterium]